MLPMNVGNRQQDVTGVGNMVNVTSPATPAVTNQTNTTTQGQGGLPGLPLFNGGGAIGQALGQVTGAVGQIPGLLNGAMGQVQGALGQVGQGVGVNLPAFDTLPRFDQAPLASLSDQLRTGALSGEQYGQQVRQLVGDYHKAIQDWISNYRTSVQSMFNPSAQAQASAPAAAAPVNLPGDSAPAAAASSTPDPTDPMNLRRSRVAY